jgi:hypothetical protein
LEPRIAWYPSAGDDFRPLLFLHPKAWPADHPARLEPDTIEPAPPDIFIYTDYMGLDYGKAVPARGMVIYQDERTSVLLEEVEELPRLKFDYDPRSCVFQPPANLTGRVFFLQVRIESTPYGRIEYPVIYAITDNESFYQKMLAARRARISHVIKVRDGSGFGGAARPGTWIEDTLGKLHAEVYITDNRRFSSGPIYRSVAGSSWSHLPGDINWHLLSRSSGRSIGPSPLTDPF